MHILMLAEFFPSPASPVFSGGVETRCYQVATLLAKKHHITVFARKKTGESSREIIGNLSIFRFGNETTSSAASIKSLFPRLLYVMSSIVEAKNTKIDLVEGTNYVTYLAAFIIGTVHKIPSVAFYPDVLGKNWFKLFGWVLGSIGYVAEILFLHLSWAGYITISKTVKQRLIAAGVNEKKITVVYCGIEKPKHFIKREKAIQLISISRLVSYKRVDWSLRLLASLSQDFPKLTLTIIGSGPEEAVLKKQIQSLRLTNRVKFLSNISSQELYQELEKSKLLIHPSLIEGFGIVLLEASVYGVPFVAADIKTAKELIAKIKSGVLFKQNDLQDLIIKTKLLLKDEKKWQELQDNGLEKVSEFQWEKLAQQTQTLYSSLLNKK